MYVHDMLQKQRFENNRLIDKEDSRVKRPRRFWTKVDNPTRLRLLLNMCIRFQNEYYLSYKTGFRVSKSLSKQIVRSKITHCIDQIRKCDAADDYVLYF